MDFMRRFQTVSTRRALVKQALRDKGFHSKGQSLRHKPYVSTFALALSRYSPSKVSPFLGKQTV